ncbi:MAG: anthranilate synthase component I family protein [Campylobacter sp.]|nr:anthranilate synthase component I family protein [Campylobacter sp.]
MLLLEPIIYYKALREKFANIHLAEDTTQVIVGIDCDYISSENTDYAGLKSYFLTQKDRSDAPFAGLFGVLGYESVRYFEEIPRFKDEGYKFPNFIYANAKAYLHFDKNSKIYSFYGEKDKYYDFLKDVESLDDTQDLSQNFYKIDTDLTAEKEHFLAIVSKAKEYLKNGDIFQVVLSEQLRLTSDMDSLDFYQILSKANPSPYMFHFPTPFGDVTGSSPELVCEIKGSQIYVAPIAGTRRRGADAIEDERLQIELLSDEKELAEHKMLIDLARNDIGRVAKPRSVVVKNPMKIVRYESVMHIVTDVYGIKRDDIDAFSAIASIFPAGTLSGTPKIRAMQIISELEPYKRNAYGGGIGFLHFNGDAQQAILIRSAIFTPFIGKINELNLPNLNSGEKLSNVFIQAGAGIVFDSIPQNEYQEIRNKRASVLDVFKNHAKRIG